MSLAMELIVPNVATSELFNFMVNDEQKYILEKFISEFDSEKKLIRYNDIFGYHLQIGDFTVPLYFEFRNNYDFVNPIGIPYYVEYDKMYECFVLMRPGVAYRSRRKDGNRGLPDFSCNS